VQGADTLQSEPISARDASLLWRRQPLARTLALVAICLLAAAVPTDYLVAYALEADESFRAPSVYLSLGALLLSVRFLFGAGLGRRVAPILLVGGSIVAGMVSLLVLRWSGIGGGPLGRLDWPFRLAIISILFAYAASHARWRRPLIASYLGGWAAFVVYGLYLLAVGGADVMQHYDVERASLFGLDQNEQSVLVATGLVLLFDDMLVRGSFATVPLYLAAMLAGSVVFTSGVSRSGTLALACGLAVVLVGWMRRGTAHLTRRSFKLALVVALLCVGGVVIAQRNPLVAQAIDGLTQRMGDAFAGRDLGQRDALARETWRIALENPWHGVGFGRAQRYLGGDPHNGYLKILAEGGALAAVLLVAGLLLTGAALARQVSRGRGAGPAGSLVVLLIWAAAGQALLGLPFWFFLGVVVAGPEEDGP
jgi:hypothetical protein